MLSKDRFSKGYLSGPGFLYLRCGHDALERYAEVSSSVYLLEIYPNETRQDVVSFPSRVPFFAEESRFLFLGRVAYFVILALRVNLQPGYNTLLGILVFIKGLTTYRREILRGSHSQLREIVIRSATNNDAVSMVQTPIRHSSGSLQYYLTIIALDIVVVCIWRYADVSSNHAYRCHSYLI